MASVFIMPRGQSPDRTLRRQPLRPCPSPSRLSRAISRHASAALLLFAGLQLWGMAALNHQLGGAVVPVMAIALLLLLALPFARTMERRWRRIADTSLPSHGLVSRFRKDRTRLWVLALAVPPLWISAVAVAGETVSRL